MRASTRAYEHLREEIVTWRLLPGTPLAEVEQAARLGVSRTPLREALARLREQRDGADVEKALDALRTAAQGTDNVLPPMKQALAARATVGEVCHALRGVWGVYSPTERF